MSPLRFLLIPLPCLGLAAGLAVASVLWERPALPDRREPVQWHMPPGTSRVPLVLLLEDGSIAAWTGSSPWIEWFLEQGIAVALLRGPADGAARQDWLNGACQPAPADEIRMALDRTRREQPRIDTRHFAIMGAGRRGMAALTSAGSFDAGTGLPLAVFALYPGCDDRCPIDYATDGPTRVQIFYGSNDDLGQRGAYGHCRQQAGGMIGFHSIAGASHGYDGRYHFTEITDRLLLRHRPDALATAVTRSMVLETLMLTRQIDN